MKNMLATKTLCGVLAAAAFAVLAVGSVGSSVNAADLWWDNSTNNNNWDDTANWSTTSGGGSTPGAVPGASDVAKFNATSLTTAQTVNLLADRSVQGLEFLSTLSNPVTLQSGGATNTLTIGSAGVINAYNSGSGEITIGVVRGQPGDQPSTRVNIVLNGDQTWQNNGSKPTYVNEFDTFSGTNSTLTHTGTGTGRLQLAGSTGVTGSIKFVQDSATSDFWLRQSGSSTYSGGVEVRKGVVFTGNSSTNFGTGTLTLGNAAGGSDAASVVLQENANITFANAIALAPNTTGTLTIQMNEDQVGVSHSKTFTGGITGTNSFTIRNNGGDDNLNFNTGSINNAGTITHTGTATTGVTTINSVIGSNVTGLTQSGPARLVLNGNNTFTGPTTISGGTLTLGATGALASSPISVGSGGTFNVSAKTGFSLANGQTLGGLGTLVGATTFGSGSLLAFDPTGPLIAQNTLTFPSFGISSLANVNWGSLNLDSPYTLIDGVQNFASAGLNNFGEVNKVDVGGGRQAYFQASGTDLQLVVVPEPAAIALAWK
jgi:fibronectin-binding autotransporter adhesin